MSYITDDRARQFAAACYHAEGSTDEQIASGEAVAIASGPWVAA